MKKKTLEAKELIKEFFLLKGFSEDRFGNLKQTRKIENEEDKEYRVKFQATSYRFEVKNVSIDYWSQRKEIRWFKIGGKYYKDVNKEIIKEKIKELKGDIS